MAGFDDGGFRNEASAEHHSVAFDGLALAVAFDIHAADMRLATHGDQPGAHQDPRSECCARDPSAGTRSQNACRFLQHRQRPDAGVAHGQQIGERHQFGPHDHRARAGLEAGQIDQLLQRAGGENAPRAGP